MSPPRNAQLTEVLKRWFERQDSIQRGLVAAQGSEPGTVDLTCRDHPRKVGEARVDDLGNVFLLAKKRTGKGSSRALQSGGRLVDQGIKIQVTWRSTAAASFDAQQEGLNWLTNKWLVGDSLPVPIGIYKCPDGHSVGTKDVEKLVEGILKALELGEHMLPLPPIDIDEADMSQFAIENIPMETSHVTDKQPA